MMMVTPASASPHAGWVSDSDIVSGLPGNYELGIRTAPTVFNMDGTWYLISGKNHGVFYGFKWTGSAWESDRKIESGLPDIGDESRPEVFCMNGTWYLISGELEGKFYGFRWTGHRWGSDSDIVSGLGDVGRHSTPDVFYKDETWYLISGETYGTFHGFRWNGSAWQSDTTIVSGLGDVGSVPTPTVFNKDGTWYLISGLTLESGWTGIHGSRWTGSAWESDPATVSGLLHFIGNHCHPTPDVFCEDGTWYLICGQQKGAFYGFHYQYPTTKPDLIPTSLQPTTLHLDQPGTLTATILNDGGGNASSFNVSLKLGESLIDTKTVDALNIGEEKSVDFTWTPTSPGTFNLTVTADPENVIDEFDETNNAIVETVTIPQPDLIPTSLQPTTLHLNQPGTLTATILNDGGGNASVFNVSLKLGEALIGTKTVDALSIGEEKSVDFTWTPTSAGTFNMTVTADTENVIDEFDETNNVMTVMVTVER
jgi:hypothetical protein